MSKLCLHVWRVSIMTDCWRAWSSMSATYCSISPTSGHNGESYWDYMADFNLNVLNTSSIDLQFFFCSLYLRNTDNSFKILLKIWKTKFCYELKALMTLSSDFQISNYRPRKFPDRSKQKLVISSKHPQISFHFKESKEKKKTTL